MIQKESADGVQRSAGFDQLYGGAAASLSFPLAV